MPRTRTFDQNFSLLFWFMVLGLGRSLPACAQDLATPTLVSPATGDSRAMATGHLGLPPSPMPQNGDAAALYGNSQIVPKISSYVFPSAEARRKKFKEDVIGPGAFTAPFIQATVDQTHPLKIGYPGDGYNGPGLHPAHGAVPEWSEGADGFSKRYASRFGMGLIGTTSRYGLGDLLREDVSYHACDCDGVFPRALHVLTASFVARTRRGRSVPSLPALISPFIAAEVATAAWYPARYNASDALRTSTLLYFAVPVKNLVKELEKR